MKCTFSFAMAAAEKPCWHEGATEYLIQEMSESIKMMAPAAMPFQK
jgi:hypothetical protein